MVKFIQFILITSCMLSSLALADSHEDNTIGQAGSDYSTNTESTFENNIGNCEDLSVLTLRGSIKNDIQRADPDSATKAHNLMLEGMELCNKNQNVLAKMKLKEAQTIAREGNVAGQDMRIGIVNESDELQEETENEKEKSWWQIF